MATCNIEHPISGEKCLIDAAKYKHTHCIKGGVNCGEGNSCTLNHVWVHNSTTTNISLDYTEFAAKITSENKLNILFTGLKMRLSNGYFYYHYKAFLAVKFYDEEKNLISTKGLERTSYYIPDQYKNSGPFKSAKENTEAWATWTTYNATYKLAEYDGNPYSTNGFWGPIDIGSVDFDIVIPDTAVSASIYIYGDSDPVYYWGSFNDNGVTTSRWGLAFGEKGCPCRTSGGIHGQVAIGTPIATIIRPISTNTFLKYYVENGVPGVKTDEYSGAPTTAANNHNNTFNAVIRPFKKGTNNPIEHIRGVIQFRKDGVPTGDYYKVPAGTSFNRKVATKLEKNADGTYTKLEDYVYSLINGTGAYVKDGDVYKDATTGLAEDKLILTSTDDQLYYRAVLESVETKNLTLDSAKTTVDFYLKEWLDDHNNGTAGRLDIKNWPLAVTPHVFNNGKTTNQRTVLCGTSAVWIDLYAKATNFIPTGLTIVEVSAKDKAGNPYTYDTYYISIKDYENPGFYENKSYSYEYFDRAAVYTISGNTVKKETRPAFTEVSTAGIPIIEGTTNYKKSRYYAAYRNIYSADLRKSKWLNTSFYSIPRAPRQLWYESTHGNKTYVSDEYAEGINSNIYKEDLRPRIKDTFIWRWDQAFGDISNPMEPTGYRVFIYLRTKKQKDTKKSRNLMALTGLNDGYLYYSVDCLNFKETTDASGKTKQTFTGITNSDGITKTTAGSQLDTDKQIPCFEVSSKYIKLDLKALGFESGDYCGCRVYSFVEHPTKGNLYSETSEYENSSYADIYKSITTEPLDYALEYTLGSSTRIYGAVNDDKSLYGITNSYSTEKVNGKLTYSPDKSFAEGGCPALVGSNPNDKKLGYDYNQSLDDCEVRNGATVWVKVSDTNTPKEDWVEGTPWVKTENGWKEADSLYVKTENSKTGWKESD
jgi:hypothetical protein